MPALANQNLFIPAGRSFFSTMKVSVFSFLARSVDIDPFLAQFGSFYERALSARALRSARRRDRFDDITKGTLSFGSGELCLRVADGTEIPMSHCSSGQQEMVPLVVSLRGLGRQTSRSTLIIEEPEAHLFPSAQQELMMELVHLVQPTAATPGQLFVTTHSPYVVSYVNNLMLAGEVLSASPANEDRVRKVMGRPVALRSQRVAAYHLEGGRVHDLVDRETGLIQADRIDAVSGTIGYQFQALLDIADAPEGDEPEGDNAEGDDAAAI